MWFNNMKPWWLAFVVTWLVTVAALSVTDAVEPTDAGRYGLVVAVAVALVVWAVMRAAARPRE